MGRLNIFTQLPSASSSAFLSMMLWECNGTERTVWRAQKVTTNLIMFNVTLATLGAHSERSEL